MNTIQNNLKFRALYVNQYVLPYNVKLTTDLLIVPDSLCPLLLTPLQKITDEDAIWVVDNHPFETESVTKLSNKKPLSLNKTISYETSNGVIRHFVLKPENLYPYHFDYLRSKGYALPWLGISVDDMVKFGWITLKD